MGTVAKAEAILNSALSNSNGSALPYDRAYEPEMRRQIREFIEAYPKTIPLKIGKFVDNDGIERQLLVFDGVIPFHYKNTKYNVPMVIWLPLKFPRVQPDAFVNLTDRNQFVYNSRCRIVDASCNGRIRSDYLANWSYPRTNLTEFVGDLQIIFLDCPPLYTNPNPGATSAPHDRYNSNMHAAQHGPSTASQAVAGPRPTTAQHQPAVTAFNPLNQGNAGRPTTATQPQQAPMASAGSVSVWGGLFSQAPSGQQQQHQPYQQQQQNGLEPPGGASVWQGALSQEILQTQQAHLQQQQEAFRQQRASAYHLALTTALSSRLSGAIEVVAAEDLQHQLTIQAELQARSAVFSQEVGRLHQEREALDSAAHELAAAGTALDTWLKENEPRSQSLRAAVSGEIDPDEAIVPSDILSEQALKAQSADLALEDALGALDRAFEAKRLPLTEYLAQVRGVSRKQFTARALSSKIAAKQMAEKAAAAVARTSISGETSGTSIISGASGSIPFPPPAPSPAQLPIGDVWHTSGGILLNPLASAARGNMR